MKKLGLVLAAIVISGISLSAPSMAQNRGVHSGMFHQERSPDGTLTGPIGPEVNGG